ncbi:Golgi integral membrane protein 4-like isoform X6 [Mya arenaria]|uniref:Golgi integral membrane protein 4-like isoform X6 n=1 Tax=Mya arenaria TaxID=6604 RepID=UPI0022E84196|nr:Golgi integral membrane protein 4-like isoform X6 [Mya arenaria]
MTTDSDMMRRNSNLPKVIVGVVLFFGLVYLVYSMNDLSGQLKNTERTAERYRREQETVASQLQDMTRQKQDLKEICDHDKDQLKKSLTALQQQHKMLNSQHEDLQTEYGKLKNEHEQDNEMHRKEDDERDTEYRQFKQERELEISNLRDNLVNLERDKKDMQTQVDELKIQLQNSLNLVQQAHERQKLVEQQFVQNQQMGAGNQGQQIGNQGQQIGNQGQQDGFQGLQAGNQVLQAGNQMGQGQGQLGFGAQRGQGGIQNNYDQQDNVQNLGQKNIVQGANLGQGLGGQMQGQGQGFQGQMNQGQGLANIPGGFYRQGALQGLNNIAGGKDTAPSDAAKDLNEAQNIDSMLESLKDKHKPIDSELLEEQQKQHQIVPPKNKHEEEDDDYHSAQKNAAVVNKNVNDDHQVHQINKPNLDAIDPGRIHGVGNHDKADEDDGAGDHDNRIENQGPVNLQVQEPRIPAVVDGKSPEHARDSGHDDSLKFRPPVQHVDNQIQPQLGLDDDLGDRKEEQMEIPARHNIQDPNEGHKLGAIEDDDDNYDDDYDDKDDDNIEGGNGKLPVAPVNNKDRGRV